MGESIETRQGEPIISFAAQAEWEAWLDANHATSNGLWMKVAKKDAGVDTVRIPEALDSALCYGWIDGQRVTYDDQFFLQRYTPRRPRSKWSRINRDKVLELERQGRMKPAGLAEVERARADGRWDAAYEGQRNATVPEDLQRALDENPKARGFFATLNSANRFAILFRVQDAKRPETRARRIASFIDMLNVGKTIYP
jgi:uncharacterized protein YdeI (YjbR/CyaY-like superfamily)